MKVCMVSLQNDRPFAPRHEVMRQLVLFDGEPISEVAIPVTGLTRENQTLAQALWAIQLPELDGVQAVACIIGNGTVSAKLIVCIGPDVSAIPRARHQICVPLDECWEAEQITVKVSATIVSYWKELSVDLSAVEQIAAALQNDGIPQGGCHLSVRGGASDDLIVRLRAVFPALRFEARQNGGSQNFILATGPALIVKNLKTILASLKVAS